MLLNIGHVDASMENGKEALPFTAAHSHLKRKYSSEETGVQEESNSMEVGVAEERVFQAKKLCTEPANAVNMPSQSFDLNFPLPGEKGLPCLVKVSTSPYIVVRVCGAVCLGVWGV